MLRAWYAEAEVDVEPLSGTGTSEALAGGYGYPTRSTPVASTADAAGSHPGGPEAGPAATRHDPTLPWYWWAAQNPRCWLNRIWH
jgi:hypothetical protein